VVSPVWGFGHACSLLLFSYLLVLLAIGLKLKFIKLKFKLSNFIEIRNRKRELSGPSNLGQYQYEL